jgi:hypothetical protein
MMPELRYQRHDPVIPEHPVDRRQALGLEWRVHIEGLAAILSRRTRFGCNRLSAKLFDLHPAE